MIQRVWTVFKISSLVMRSGACSVGRKNCYNVKPSESCINLLLIAGSELSD